MLPGRRWHDSPPPVYTILPPLYTILAAVYTISPPLDKHPSTVWRVEFGEWSLELATQLAAAT